MIISTDVHSIVQKKFKLNNIFKKTLAFNEKNKVIRYFSAFSKHL